MQKLGQQNLLIHLFHQHFGIFYDKISEGCILCKDFCKLTTNPLKMKRSLLVIFAQLLWAIGVANAQPPKETDNQTANQNTYDETHVKERSKKAHKQSDKANKHNQKVQEHANKEAEKNRKEKLSGKKKKDDQHKFNF